MGEGIQRERLREGLVPRVKGRLQRRNARRGSTQIGTIDKGLGTGGICTWIAYMKYVEGHVDRQGVSGSL